MRRWVLFLAAVGLTLGSATATGAATPGRRWQATPLYGEKGRIVKWDCGGACLPGWCCELSAE